MTKKAEAKADKISTFKHFHRQTLAVMFLVGLFKKVYCFNVPNAAFY